MKIDVFKTSIFHVNVNELTKIEFVMKKNIKNNKHVLKHNIV